MQHAGAALPSLLPAHLSGSDMASQTSEPSGMWPSLARYRLRLSVLPAGEEGGEGGQQVVSKVSALAGAVESSKVRRGAELPSHVMYKHIRYRRTKLCKARSEAAQTGSPHVVILRAHGPQSRTWLAHSSESSACSTARPHLTSCQPVAAPECVPAPGPQPRPHPGTCP